MPNALRGRVAVQWYETRAEREEKAKKEKEARQEPALTRLGTVNERRSREWGWKDDFLREHWGKKTPTEIGQAIDKSRHSVCQRATKLGLPRKAYDAWNPDRDELLKKLWGRVHFSEVIRLVGMSPGLIHKRVHFLGLETQRAA